MLDQQIVFILDKIGIFAFSFMAVAMGAKKKLDIFGLLVIGVSSAIGGGIIRDVMLNRIPFAISHPDYLMFAYGASILAIILFYFKLLIPSKILTISDTLGLGAFAAAGATVSINLNLSIFHTVLFAVITAVGGGLIRDILLNEIPFVLKREIYATAAGLGGFIIHLLFILGLNISYSVIIGLSIVIISRFFSIKKQLHLPVI